MQRDIGFPGHTGLNPQEQKQILQSGSDLKIQPAFRDPGTGNRTPVLPAVARIDNDGDRRDCGRFKGG